MSEIIDNIYNKLVNIYLLEYNNTKNIINYNNSKKIVFDKSNRKKWNILSKDIKFKKIKEFLLNNNYDKNINMTLFKFMNIKYSIKSQCITSLILKNK